MYRHMHRKPYTYAKANTYSNIHTVIHENIKLQSNQKYINNGRNKEMNVNKMHKHKNTAILQTNRERLKIKHITTHQQIEEEKEKDIVQINTLRYIYTHRQRGIDKDEDIKIQITTET